MSPIGRVFIVLNLALAGGFVAFAGTHLQQQSNYKQKLADAEKKASDKEQVLNSQIAKLTNENAQLGTAKDSLNTELLATKNQLAQSTDENSRLSKQLDSMDGTIKELNTASQALTSTAKAAMDQADAAYKMAIADQKVKDDSVRAKDAAEAENRLLKNEIASLNGTVEKKNVEIAGLQKDLNEQHLLVSVATQNGFVPALAAPALNGTVAHVANNRLCTIKITDNPGNVDIADQLAKRKFSFAIYDASGYKGEAVATEYHASENAITCTLMLTKGEIKSGDLAATKTP